MASQPPRVPPLLPHLGLSPSGRFNPHNQASPAPHQLTQPPPLGPLTAPQQPQGSNQMALCVPPVHQSFSQSSVASMNQIRPPVSNYTRMTQNNSFPNAHLISTLPAHLPPSNAPTISSPTFVARPPVNPTSFNIPPPNYNLPPVSNPPRARFDSSVVPPRVNHSSVVLPNTPQGTPRLPCFISATPSPVSRLPPAFVSPTRLNYPDNSVRSPCPRTPTSADCFLGSHPGPSTDTSSLSTVRPAPSFTPRVNTNIAPPTNRNPPPSNVQQSPVLHQAHGLQRPTSLIQPSNIGVRLPNSPNGPNLVATQTSSPLQPFPSNVHNLSNVPSDSARSLDISNYLPNTRLPPPNMNVHRPYNSQAHRYTQPPPNLNTQQPSFTANSFPGTCQPSNRRINNSWTSLAKADSTAFTPIQQQAMKRPSNSFQSSGFKKKFKYEKPIRPFENKFYCDICDRGFGFKDKYEEHVSEHQQCRVKGCPYVAAPKLVKIHFNLQHKTGLASKVWQLESEDDIKKWREARKSNYPTPENIVKKKQIEEEKKERGEVLEDQYFGKMSKLDKNRNLIQSISKALSEDSENVEKPLVTKGKACKEKFPHKRQRRKRQQKKEEQTGDKKLSLLQKLLAKEIRHERNVVLQCLNYIVKNNFFDK